MLERFVRRRVPDSEVDDVVQTVLCDALASDNIPDDDEQLRKWVIGIGRHKVADFHRQGGRGRKVELPAELGAAEEAHSAREWMEWAEQQTEGDSEAQRTLDWMAREGGGEKLAHIAADEKVPATQIRQRVSRMRRFMRQRWAAELSAVAAIVAAVLVAWYWLRRPQPTAEVLPTPVPEIKVPEELLRAQQLREDAFDACVRQEWRQCLERFDEAARLDPAGDRADDVRAARESAERGKQLLEEEEKKQLEEEKGKQEENKPAPPAPTPKRTKEPPVDLKKQMMQKGEKESVLEKEPLQKKSKAAAPLPSDTPSQQPPK